MSLTQLRFFLLWLTDPVPIAWDYDDPAPIVEWDIFDYEIVTNPTLGIEQIIWSDTPVTIEVENSVRSTPLNPPRRPDAYYIPASWEDAIAVLGLHGIETEVLTEEVTVDVVNYRIEDFTFGTLREGRATVSGTPVPELCSRTYKPNDVVVSTDQPLGTLAVALLEPTGESSLFYWGFFNSQFVSQEYGENYMMVPIAEKLLEENEEVASAWDVYKADNPDYADDADAVIEFFFRFTAFYDAEAYLYPVGIVYPPGSAPTVLPTAPPIPTAAGFRVCFLYSWCLCILVPIVTML